MAKITTAYSFGKLRPLNQPSLSSVRSNNSFKPMPLRDAA
ncbi:hypothetical protein FHR59_000445 [Xanthomonas arboricola]|nr:hypothetical protein [Xanthomonas arboricola]SOU05280.1 hypothetical protein LMG19144_00315 [Xanthomonas arboricola pv. fragariae]MBB3797378.1 hypothetical protein [Xanthomonas arboricola]MBB4597426.1 hypothetical protein [Xanthomonas arboricola]MBB4767965.1 hypothetical protein [Xanthomonas arboricola]